MSGRTFEGEVLAEGTFRVDKRRALDKLERFRLADPYRYVVELLAAAVCAGASGVQIDNDSDDFVLSWQGDLPTADELDALFDHLWGQPSDPHAAMLQHLAIGLLGARGLHPRWVRLDCETPAGAVRLDLDDPVDTRTMPLDDAPNGLRCHVRERLGGAVLEELLTPWRPPTESRILQGAARWCPLPVFLHGQRLASAQAPEAAVASWSGSVAGRSGKLWITPPPSSGSVDLLLHGVALAQISVDLGSLGVVGWFRDDALKLGASRARVVEDEAWRACHDALIEAVDSLALQVPTLLARDAASDTLRWIDAQGSHYRATRSELLLILARAALCRLLKRGVELGALARLPLLVDLRGESWSVERLAALAQPPAVLDQPQALPDDLGRVVFLSRDLDVLTLLQPEVYDISEELLLRERGRQRRQRAREQARFAAAPQGDAFRHGALQGWVALQGGKGREIQVELRLGGVPVCSVSRPSPAGPMRAVLDHPGFSTDVGFSEVLEDEVWDGAMAALAREALALTVRTIRDGPQREAMELLTGLLQRRDGALSERVAALPDALASLALFPSADGQLRSVRQLASLDASVWVLSDREHQVLPPDLAPRVLRMPPSVERTWRRWLGPLARDPSEARDLAERARRMARPRRQAKLERACLVSVDVSREGVSGQLGVPAPSLAMGARRQLFGSTAAHGGIMLLRQGVEVCQRLLPLRVPGLIGALEVPALEVNLAHQQIADAPAVALAAQLAPAVDSLMEALWQQEGLHARVVDWLIANPPVPGGARATRPLLRHWDGSWITLDEVRRVARKKRSRKLRLLHSDPAPMRGFGGTLRGDHQVVRLLDFFAPKRWRDAQDEVAEARASYQDFIARTQLRALPQALASEPVVTPSWRGVYLLPTDPETIGLAHITCLYEGRPLTRRVSTVRMGATLVVEQGFGPNTTWTNVADSQALTHLKRGCGDALEGLITQAAAGIGGSRQPRSWLALLTRLSTRSSRIKGRTRLRDQVAALPLVLRLDRSWVTPQAVWSAVKDGVDVGIIEADTAPGPSDHPWYLLRTPGLAPALEALCGAPLPDHTARLADWHKGQARRRSLRPAPKRLPGAALLRERLATPLAGEIVLRPVNLTPGLIIHWLIDGLPVASEHDPEWPGWAEIRVEAPGLRAAPSFDAVVHDQAYTTLRARLLTRLNALVQRLSHELDADSLSWLQGWLLAGGGGVDDAPVFERLGGDRVGLSQLQAMEAAGGVTVVFQPLSFSHPLPPLVADAELRLVLARRFRVVPLDGRLRTVPPPRVDSCAGPVRPPHGGELFIPTDPDACAVQVRVAGVALPELVRPELAVPLSGWIEVPDLHPPHTWDSLGDDTAPLDAALDQAARALIGQLLDRDPSSALLRRALRRLCADAPSLRAVAAGPHPDPLIERLANLCVFRNSLGERAGSLRTLLQDPPIRAVDVGVYGLARRPVWWLPDDTRAWLRQVVKVRDATQALAREDAAQRRREAPPWPKRSPPGAYAHASAKCSLRLWLDPVEDPGVDVLSAGVKVCTYPLPVWGLAGWVDGPLETNIDFTQATLPEDVLRALHDGAERLLNAVQTRDLQARLLASMERDGRAAICAKGSPWRQVAVCTDIAGEPITLAQLLELGRAKLRICTSDTPAQVEPGVRVVRDSHRDLLSALLGGRLDWVLSQAEVVEHEVAVSELAARRWGERLEQRAEEWGAPRASARYVRPTLPSWANTSEDSEALASWVVAAERCRMAGAPLQELDVIAALARVLARMA